MSQPSPEQLQYLPFLFAPALVLLSKLLQPLGNGNGRSRKAVDAAPPLGAAHRRRQCAEEGGDGAQLSLHVGACCWRRLLKQAIGDELPQGGEPRESEHDKPEAARGAHRLVWRSCTQQLKPGVESKPAVNVLPFFST
ncbi:hypothetical protein ABPG75_012007 [Micractinium tetrahymenae]